MKFNLKFAAFVLLLTGISFALSRCKPDVAPVEAPDSITADTIASVTAVDTVQVKDKASIRTPLTLIINNLASETSPVYVSLYSIKNKFPSKTDRIKEYKFTPHGDVLTAEIDDMDYGEFALATYQDVNVDGKCNQNFIGIPKEPYGFSNNYRPKLKAPNFNDCNFAYDKTTHSLTIAMIR